MGLTVLAHAYAVQRYQLVGTPDPPPGTCSLDMPSLSPATWVLSRTGGPGPGACRRWWPGGGVSRLGGTVRADRLVVALPGAAVAVLNEEAARAAELIGLLGNDPDRELLTGQVSAGQLHRLGGVDLIHRPRPGVVAHHPHQRSRVVHQLIPHRRPGGVVISGHHTVLTEEKKLDHAGSARSLSSLGLANTLGGCCAPALRMVPAPPRVRTSNWRIPAHGDRAQ